MAQFADDFDITQDQADTLNARIAADKETTTMQTTTTTNETQFYGQPQPGETVFAIIDSVAKSGMSRTMRLFVIRDNEPIFITRSVADLLDNPMKAGSMRVRGCGMDMVFATVYSLGMKLYNDGYTLKYRTI